MLKQLFCTARRPGSGASDYQCMSSSFSVKSDDNGRITMQCTSCKTTHDACDLYRGEVPWTADTQVAEVPGAGPSKADDFAAAHDMAVSEIRGKCENYRCGYWKSSARMNCNNKKIGVQVCETWMRDGEIPF